METVIYTVHSRGRPNELHVIGDYRQRLGVIPPLWAGWHRLWATLGVMVALLALAILVAPALFGTAWAALFFIATFEGAEIERLEYRLWGWREVAIVEARTEEGAEELYLTGRAIT